MKDIIRIGNGQGFWGDSVDAPVNLAKDGPLDYLTLDYLAEVTLSIMQRQKLKNPNAGYARDFIDLIRRILPEIQHNGIVDGLSIRRSDACLFYFDGLLR